MYQNISLFAIVAIGLWLPWELIWAREWLKQVKNCSYYEGLVSLAEALQRSPVLRRRLYRTLIQYSHKNRSIVLQHVGEDLPGRATRDEVEMVRRYVLQPSRTSFGAYLTLLQDVNDAFDRAELLRQKIGWVN